MQQEINKPFSHDGKEYVAIAVASASCKECAFMQRKSFHCTADKEIVGECTSHLREDNQHVIFKKL